VFIRDMTYKARDELLHCEFGIKSFIGSKVFEKETDKMSVIGSDSSLSDNRALGVAADVADSERSVF